MRLQRKCDGAVLTLRKVIVRVVGLQEGSLVVDSVDVLGESGLVHCRALARADDLLDLGSHYLLALFLRD